MAVEKYSGCYIGFPLSDEVEKEWTDIRSKLILTVPDVRRDIPPGHVTAYYLGQQTKEQLQHAEEIVCRSAHLVHGMCLIIGGWGVFENEHPAMYLRVRTPAPVLGFIASLQSAFGKPELPYVGHVTLVELDSRLEYRVPEKLVERAEKLRMCFPVEEVKIWGRENRKLVSLVTIPAGKVTVG